MYYSADLFKNVFCLIQFKEVNSTAASLIAQMVHYGAKVDSDVLKYGIITDGDASHIYFNEGVFSRKRIEGKVYRAIFSYDLNGRMPFNLFSQPVAFLLEGPKGFERLYYRRGIMTSEMNHGIHTRSYWFNETGDDIEHPGRVLNLANEFAIKRHDNNLKTLTKLFNVKDPEPKKIDIDDEVSTIISEE